MRFPHYLSPSLSAALLLLAGALAPATAQAAPTDPLERARDLFVQAEVDEDHERWSDALDKLRAVSQVKLTAGVRYHLALCEEHLGQLARALGDYYAAEHQARVEDAKDVLRIVGKQLASLDPRVPRVTFRVVPATVQASITLDGEPVVDALSGRAVPVDPGTHRVEATAPARPGWTQVVTLQESESKVLDVDLAVAPSPATPVSPAVEAPLTTPSSPPPTRANRGLAIVATGAAIALAGAGLAAFLVADAEHDHAVTNCARIFDPSLCEPLKDRVHAWDFAAGGTWVGGLVAGTMAIVLWTQAESTAHRVGARFIALPGAVGVDGRF